VPEEVALATTVRRTAVSIPAAALGPENPLPALRPLGEVHRPDLKDREGLPADMARQLGYAPLRSVLPVRVLDGYGRDRAPAALDALVIENDRIRATVLPGLGGRLYSLVHKPTGRELLYRNPVFQPVAFALAGAWFSGGVEWNLGATGHAAHTCAPLHAARVPAPDGGEMLRLWEWERLRDLPFQIDMWLPADSDFLHVGVRVRNPHDRTVPAYWWSNIAVPETDRTRVIAPADAAWHFGYGRTLSHVPVPAPDGATDITYTTRSEYPADYFFDVADSERRWITALDGEGHGLVQTSTDLLRGRKLFLWGQGRGGRHWQEWLTEPGTGGYLEIQAGLARTQLEHIPMAADSEFSWLEVYGPLTADAAVVHGDDWAAARAEAAGRLEAALPRAAVDAAYEAWLGQADADPKDVLATGSGWGALESERGHFQLPGTPFPATTLGDPQKPWLELLLAGVFPRPVADAPPGPALVSPPWRELLESADTYPGNEWFRDYYLGIAQWAAGDRAQAVRSWERSVAGHPSPWALRALAVAEADAGQPQRAADRYLAAYDCLRETFAALPDRPDVRRALVVEAVPALLAADRVADAERVLAETTAALDGKEAAAGGRLRLLTARTALARGDAAAARAVFDEGFVVEDLYEGAEALTDTWYAIAERLIAGDGPITDDIRTRARTEHPLPAAYDFRMHPDPPP
jgi:tetratricopeptide (TPR) repeat protein